MRITPLDIRKQEFRKTMRGLDSDEVYAFLTTVAEEYETVLSDNKRLRERIVEIEDRLKEFKSMETNLRNTLLTAEKITAEAKENARKEAGLIVREAEVEAEKAAEAIRAHTQQLRREILELKKHKDNYITRLRTLVESHQNVIAGFEDDFAQTDREIEKIGQKVEADTDAAVKGTRMSRDRITEEFAHEETTEEKDKFIWEDEERLEEKPRPSMPERPRHDDDSRGRGEESPDVESSLRDQQDARQGGRPVGTLSGQEDAPAGAARGEKALFDEVGAEHIEVADETDHGEDGHFNENSMRREVARSIEGRMYPEPAMNESPDAGRRSREQVSPEVEYKGSRAQVEMGEAGPYAGMPGAGKAEDDSPGQSPEPQGMVVTETEPERTGRETMPRTDDWKSYEVDEARQDWSKYEIGASGSRAPEKTAPPQALPEEDNEVEQALSGLEEFGSVDEDPQAGQSGEGPDNEPRPRDIAASRQPAPQDRQPEASQPSKPVAPAQTSGQPPEGSAEEEEEGSTWSMEELRKNLTNIDRDD